MKNIVRVLVVSAVLALFVTPAHAYWSVSWSDGSTDEDGFRVMRKVGTGAYAQVGSDLAANTVKFDDMASTSNVVYCYQIVSFNAFGSNASAEACTVAGNSPNAPGTPQMQWKP